MQLAQSYLQGQASPFDGVLEAYGQGQVLRENKDLLQAKQAEQARKIQAQQQLEQLDWNDMGAVSRVVAQFPEYTKGAQDYYKNMEAKEQQAYLADSAKSMSAIDSGRPEIAVNSLRDKAAAYRDMGNEAKADELSDLAEWIAKDPKSARKAIAMGYAVNAPKDAASSYKSMVDADIAENESPYNIAETQAKTGETQAKTITERVTAAGGVNKLISTAALTDNPNTFMEMIDTAYDAGLIAPEKYNSLVESVSGDGEEAVATLRRLARGNPDIIKELLPQATYTNLGDSVAVTDYNPQTGEFANKGTMDVGLSPNQEYSSNANIKIAGVNQEGANYRAGVQAETSRYNTDQQTIAKMHNIDLQDKQADKKLALAYAIEDNKKGVSKLENHGGKMYWVYPDQTAIPAKDINGKDITPTVNNDSTTRKAVAEQQAAIDSGQELLRVLRKAKTLSEQGLFYGAGANARANAAQVVGGTEKSKRTLEYNTLITNSALQSMKSIFGGNPTEGERAILLKIQASSDYPRDVREKLLNEAIAAANNRIKSNQNQIKTLQGGSGATSSAASTKTNYSSVIEPLKK